MQSVPITTDVSSNPDQGEVYIHCTLCDKVSDLQQVCGFLHQKTDRHDITEILLKVVLNTIKPTNQPYVSMIATLKVFSSISFNIKIQLIDQIHINLFFVVSGLSPKSNRS
jgi:hypothetical protein